MRPSNFVVFILLLSLILTKAQAIRLGKGSLTVQQQQKQNQQDEESSLLKTSNVDAEEAVLCKEEQCTGNIKNRKLVTTSVSTTPTTSKNVKNGGNGAHPSVHEKVKEAEEIKGNMMGTSNSKDLSLEHYHDIVEMDYSPAKRKPPIHN